MNLTSVRLIVLGFMLGVVASSAAAAHAQRSPAPDALIASPDHYKLELENEFVR